jgi:hypothetical protein
LANVWGRSIKGLSIWLHCTDTVDDLVGEYEAEAEVLVLNVSLLLESSLNVGCCEPMLADDHDGSYVRISFGDYCMSFRQYR